MSDQDGIEQGTGRREAQAANLFDLRRVIGGLFVLYGVVLTIAGLGESDAEIAKAAGVRINLIAGLGMLALGIAFLVWGFLRPLGRHLQEAERDAPVDPRGPGGAA